MYEEKVTSSKKEEHLQMASDMASAICDRSPEQQNAMVKQIHSVVKERRSQMIDEAEKNASWLKETIQEL